MEFGKGDPERAVLVPRPKAFFWPWPERQVCGQLLFGLPVFKEKDFLGTVYPSKASMVKALTYYSQQYQTLELNATFYATPQESTVIKWCSQVSKDFLFCPKVPKDISHEWAAGARLKAFEHFLHVCRVFGHHLGAVFLQLPPSFDVSLWHNLKQLLSVVPADFPLHVEFRHASWIRAHSLWRDWFFERGIGVVLVDGPGVRELFHLLATRNELFVRFVGQMLHPSDYLRIEWWQRFLAVLFQRGLKRCYFMMHQEREVKGHELAVALANGLEIDNVEFKKPFQIREDANELDQLTLF